MTENTIPKGLYAMSTVPLKLAHKLTTKNLLEEANQTAPPFHTHLSILLDFSVSLFSPPYPVPTLFSLKKKKSNNNIRENKKERKRYPSKEQPIWNLGSCEGRVPSHSVT